MKNIFKKAMLTLLTAALCVPVAVGFAACGSDKDDVPPASSNVVDMGTYVINKLTLTSNGETMGVRINMPKEYDTGKKLPVIIMCVGAEQLMESMSDFAKTCSGGDYATVQFDYTNTGYAKTTSTGEETGKSLTSMCNNIDDIIQYLSEDEEERFDMDKIALCGYSLGGLVSTVYASRNPDKISQLMLYAPAYDMHYRARGNGYNDDGTRNGSDPEWGDPYAEDAPAYVESESTNTGIMSNLYIKECWDLDYSKFFDVTEGYAGKVMYCVGTADSLRFYGQEAFEYYMADSNDRIFDDETMSEKGKIYRPEVEFTRDDIEIYIIGNASHNMIKEQTSVLLEVFADYLEANPL